MLTTHATTLLLAAFMFQPGGNADADAIFEAATKRIAEAKAGGAIPQLKRECMECWTVFPLMAYDAEVIRKAQDIPDVHPLTGISALFLELPCDDASDLDCNALRNEAASHLRKLGIPLGNSPAEPARVTIYTQSSCNEGRCVGSAYLVVKEWGFRLRDVLAGVPRFALQSAWDGRGVKLVAGPREKLTEIYKNEIRMQIDYFASEYYIANPRGK